MNFQLPQNFAKKKPLQELVSVDLAADGTRCVRMRKTGDNVSVLAVDILPVVNISETDEDSGKQESFALPKPLSARYASIVIPSDTCVVKLLNLPKQLDEKNADTQLREHLGLEDGEFRVGYTEVGKGHGRSEIKVLAVAVNEAIVRSAIGLFPVGTPAPASVELSGLSVFSAFLNGPAKNHADEAVGIIDCGPKTSFVAFFLKNEPVLIRKFEFGTLDILDRIQKDLGVDRDTALDIISDESFDVSQSVRSVSEAFIKQLVISRHFVERREDCRISKIFAPGGSLTSHNWLNEVKSALGLDVDFWDPFDAVELPENVLNEKHNGVRSSFAAAIGAGFGLFEENA